MSGDALMMAHQCAVNPLTGGAIVSVPLRTSPGREGFSPELALSYVGGQRGAFGVGWALAGIPSISVDMREALPSDDPRQTRYVFDGASALVPALKPDGQGGFTPIVSARSEFEVRRFRAKIERSFERFERWTHRLTGRVHWLAYGRTGVISCFGRAADDSSRVASPDDPHRVSQWLLDAQYHPKGSAIALEYKSEDGHGLDPRLSFEARRTRHQAFAQRYLKRIRYGNSAPLSLNTPEPPDNAWRFEVVFDYGEHVGPDAQGDGVVATRPWLMRQDPSSVYRAGFEVRTLRLCQRVLMIHRFPEWGDTPRIVGATELHYDHDPSGARLSTLTWRGYRRDADDILHTRQLAPLQLRYHDAKLGAGFEVAAPTDNLPVGIDGASAQWVDLRGEGVPGILSRHSGAWYFKEGLGQGRFGPLERVDEVPAAILASMTLRDFDGDGDLDLVGVEGREAGYYSYQRDSARWDGFRTFETLARADMRGANAQWIDLNGDGFADLLIERSDRLVWYPSRGAHGFDPAITLSRPDTRAHGAPTLSASAITRFADMTGDGLLDMVRLDNGRVEYWPNLGRGVFGEGVVMEGAPTIDAWGELSLGRLMLIDLVGDGCADLLYLARGELRLWRNQSGNQFAPEQRLGALPYLDNLAALQVIDLLGDGSRCLVWSSALPTREGHALHYLRLGDATPHHALVSVSHGAGLEHRLSYRSSAQDYLRDKASASPWHTRLPRHTLVVAQHEVIDHLSHSHLITQYHYRDGRFDGEERRLIGFGLVEQREREGRAEGGLSSGPAQPLVMVRRWHHTGDEGDLKRRSRDHYQGDAQAPTLPHPKLITDRALSADTQRDALRALAGTLWREEHYSLDHPDGPHDPAPFQTTTIAYQLRCVQPPTATHDAVFTATQSELLRCDYERDPHDPSLTHELVLESGAYGDVLTRASISYPRRALGPHVLPQQQQLHVDLAEHTMIQRDEDARFELGIELETRRLSLVGLTPDRGAIFSLEGFTTQAATARLTTITQHEPAPATPHAIALTHTRSIFWDDTLSAPAPFGEVGALTLLHHVTQAVVAERDRDALYQGRVSAETLRDDGLYHLQDGLWWADDTTYSYGPREAFYRLTQAQTPGSAPLRYSFDPHALMIVATEDGANNRVTQSYDYQALAPALTRDENDNITETRYDALGVPHLSAHYGEQLGEDGATHRVGDAPLATHVMAAGLTLADALADPEAALQGASQRLLYDLEAFARGDGPTARLMLTREVAVYDGEGAGPLPGRARVEIAYLDGLGRTLQAKLRDDPGLAITRVDGEVALDEDGAPRLSESPVRWLVSGHEVYHSKGWLLRQYEPWHSPTHSFEDDTALRRYGVATHTRYDALGRPVREDLPHGVYHSTAYHAWRTIERDPNDNVRGSAYETARAALNADAPERRALTQAQAHADTPTLIDLDGMGRPIRTTATLGPDEARVTTVSYNPWGLVHEATDGRGLTALSYRYDMLGRACVERSQDAGERVTLHDAAGRVVHHWDARGVHAHHQHDALGRPLTTHVRGPDQWDGATLDHLVHRLRYGDDPARPDASLRNARGRVILSLDQAGAQHIDRYHLDGAAIDTRRAIRQGYKGAVSWDDASSVTLGPAEHRALTRLDARSRPIMQRLPDGTTREYAYGAAGHVREVLLTTSDGAMTRQAIASQITHNARGQRVFMRYGNGVETRYSYERETTRLKRMHALREEGQRRDYLDLRYTYDAVGNITRWLDRAQGPDAASPWLSGAQVSAACEFDYDALYQLTRATGRVHQALLPQDDSAGRAGINPIKGTRHLSLNNGAALERYTRTYTYDLAGNLQRMHHQGASRAWAMTRWTSATSNRALPALDPGGVPVVNPEARFDANGNTLSLPNLRALDWDYADQLARAVIIDRAASGGLDDAEYYVYGADGMRVRRVTERLVGGGLEISETLYLDGCEVHTVRTGATIKLLRYTSHLSDGATRLATLHQWRIDLLGQETDDITKPRLHYLLSNHLGSVSLELDATGGVISYEAYFPFGGTSFLAGSSARDVKLKEYRYSGKCRDDATGLYYYGYRYYAPLIGNWLSPDPLGPVDGLNLYTFVRNNPICLVDADGLESSDLRVNLQRSARPAPEVEAYLNANPGAREQFHSGEIAFRRIDGDWRMLTREQGDAYISAQNEAGITPTVTQVERNVMLEAVEQIVNLPANVERRLEERRLAEAEEASDHSMSAEGGGAGMAEASGEPEQIQLAHAADGSSGTGSTTQGKTGESGSNGGATTGSGQGSGQGGATSGQAERARASRETSGSGQRSRPPKHASAPPDPSTDTRTSQTGGPASQPGAPRPPPQAPTSADGIILPPGTSLPPDMPTTGTRVDDPAQARVGDTPTLDPRATLGLDPHSGATPDGLAGGVVNAPHASRHGTRPKERDAHGTFGGTKDQEIPRLIGKLYDTGLGTRLSELVAYLRTVDVDKSLEHAQTGLDVAGMVPAFGEVADGLSGVISLARGDYLGAALSFAAMVPLVGNAAGAAKLARKARKQADVAFDTMSAGKAAKKPDNYLENWGEVFYRKQSTQIGTDTTTVNVAKNVMPHKSLHDVIIHGKPYDKKGAMFHINDETPLHAQQIADAIKSNPNYKTGQSIRLITCYGGCGPAQELANIMNTRVIGATSVVNVLGLPSSPPILPSHGKWFRFTPNAPPKKEKMFGTYPNIPARPRRKK